MLGASGFRKRKNICSFLFNVIVFYSSFTARQARASFWSFSRAQLAQNSLRRMHSLNDILESPSAERNKAPIWDVLDSQVFRPNDDDVVGPLNVLEIAAGAGVHTVYFAKNLIAAGRNFQWIPTDPDEPSRMSTQARLQQEPDLASVVSKPLPLTLESNGICETETSKRFQPESLDMIMAINMIHIAPWAATEGLMHLVRSTLRSNGVLFLYGPFKVGGCCVESNM